jgi:hypothetical protein
MTEENASFCFMVIFLLVVSREPSSSSPVLERGERPRIKKDEPSKYDPGS